MTAVVRHNNQILAKIEFYALPRVGDEIKLRNGSTYTINKITFVESEDTSEVDCISHIEVEVK